MATGNSDKRFFQLTLAIQKAINSIETPVKEKHVRSTIIGTFQEQSAVTYWMVALRLPLQDNRIVAWKFCHVTHKLLREGHPACLDDSQRHIGMIENLGKLWVHLREGYGKLVHLYCNLLVCKLKFHARNPRFPGNMQLTADELDNIAENDVNNYFQICVELFDYMDEILNLQAAVFDSLGNARANSMTASGQCRLAALIPGAQDASQLYDCNVRLLFRLHAALPPDTLAGHRERFRQQFKKLSSFYKHASSLQYYRNLLTLPVLPSNPPNFLQQSDFGTYVTPVVSVPEPPPDEVDSVGALIDTSDTMSQMTDHFEELDVRPSPSPQPDPIVERDRLIDHLQNELKRMRGDIQQMVQERNTMVSSMKEHCTRLEKQLQSSQVELEEEKQKAEIFAQQTPEIQQKLTVTEEKMRTTDEKFQKLKGAYTQLREEHIALIRQKAEVDKLTASLRAAAAQHESAKAQLQQQLNDRIKDVEILQQSASSSEEIEVYKTEISNVRTELEQARQKEIELETVKASLESLQIEHNTTRAEQEEKINTIATELKETTETLQRITKEKEEIESELVRVKEELLGVREKSGDEYKKVIEEKEMALKEIEQLKKEHQQEKEELSKQTNDRIVELQTQIETLLQNNIETESNYALECEKLNNDLSKQHDEFNDLINKKDVELNEALNKIQEIEIEIAQCKEDYEIQITEKCNEINLKQDMIDKLTTEYSEIKVLLENKNDELENLKQEMELTLDKNNNVIKQLQEELEHKSQYGDKHKFESESLAFKLSELESSIKDKDRELEEANTKLNELNCQIENLKQEYESERNENKYQFGLLQTKLETVTESKDEIITNLKNMIVEKDNQVITLNVENTKLSEEVSRLSEQLNETQAELEIGNNELLTLKDEHYNIVNRNEDNLTMKNKELRALHEEIKQLKYNITELENEKEILNNNYITEKQTLEARIEHTDRKRLTAESELQDLLQHNNILEADVVAFKKQLEEANRNLEEQSKKLVSCTSDVAVNIMSEALSALERSNAQETNKAGAELAAKALEDLADCTEIAGNEEKLAKSSLCIAHNAAQLSAYVTEVSHLCTDIELSEKLTSECRSMLSSTKQCLESVRAGRVSAAQCVESRGRVACVIQSAVARDAPSTAHKCVDDELADMDSAIEQAASQIEGMLAASRAADSGVQLEVNEKILDACTALMAAVKVLVQDARCLQNELGDVKTRQKMYRKNPQWSEGLISAAKAVVFAAKLLVEAADEAVGGGGRLEGVSAAAQEVAGATAQLVAASRARAPPAAPALSRLAAASRHVPLAAGAVLAAVRAAKHTRNEREALDTSSLTLTATRRLEMESKVRSLELEAALDAERVRLAALRKHHYHLAQLEENGNVTNGKQ